MQSGDDLARMPKMGRLCGFKRNATRMLRRWPISKFENWLIFYLARRDGIAIVHVIHGARDIDNLLDG
jgi:plasmid stabilization system protein ParE